MPFLEVANFISYPDLSVLQVSFIVIVFLAVLLSCDIDAAAGAYFFSMAEIIVSAILLCPSLDGCGKGIESCFKKHYVAIMRWQ